jgi:VWFA-related protein
MRTAAACVLSAAALVAQEKPTFRVATRLVQVSVIVQDRQGHPIEGLTAADFHLFDGGAEQRIELFSETGIAARAETPPTAPAPSIAPAPGEFSNRIRTSGSATVVLFDKLNTPDADQRYARQHLVGFLRQIREEDRVGIYILEGNSVRVLHDFSNDARSLVRAVQRYEAMTSIETAAAEAPPPDAPDTGDAALDAQLARLIERNDAEMRQHFNGLRSNATIAAFSAIAGRLGAIEGRKSLIWITSGFPVDALRVRNVSRTVAIQRLVRPLTDADVSVYAVDARGLVGALQFDSRGGVSFTTMSSVATNLDILQIASEETGGKASYNTNDIQRAVRRAIDDGRVTYTLGYYPTHAKWDGTYRQIKVKVERPGVQVRHRTGYFAGAPTERLRTTVVNAAIETPLEVTRLGLTARVERSSSDPGAQKIVVKTEPGAVTLSRAGDDWAATVDFVIAQKLPDGTVRKDVNRTIDMRLPPERYETARTGGLTIDATVTLQPDVQSLHIVVHDVPSGSTGSIVIPRSRLPR